ncbi:pyridoxamine 5'-phosphate oxidase family protein [Deinococcus cavernae]|uniref:Pyridoxamine 5'-phosphate oxidase family protein n=1 Tax=Deinococcus cavernae TaxID=2320857 RepID=A0A418V5B6_9DEIO|nr:pyridoxamine 5'-phosphate oxidase family protein [Deinococcus cavernae]RJF71257.1 pyridoxamine 5'-phosphate oxidase family protein [Deinococcus cavernae]
MTDFYDPRQRGPSLSRRPHNRRDDGWISELLRRGRIGRVATLWQGEDGQAFPFITPLAYVYRPHHGDIVYHTNIVGRLRANTDQGQPATFETSEIGGLLPSNSPLELSVQYRSVIVFGRARVLTDPDEKRGALTELSERVFPGLRVGQETRPISDADLARTSVYSLHIERWSGKENWPDEADQEGDWPALPAHLLHPWHLTERHDP